MDWYLKAAVGLAFAFLIHYYTRDLLSTRRHIGTETINDEYDYIVVGGGSAGSVVATRLSEDEGTTVLLLEAGGHFNENPMMNIPLLWSTSLGTEYDWSYVMEPQKHSFWGLNDNKALWHGGRVLGGSGMMNVLMWVRGSKHDFDEWESNGCKGWGYADVLPYFRKSEDILIDELKLSKYHSTEGPIAISETKVTPLAGLYLKAGEELGYNISDYNGEEQEGFSRMQTNVRDGVRSSSGAEYFARATGRNNVHIALRSYVTKIEIENKKATGVYVIRNGKKQLIKARKEIIVSAGAINTPKLLMLSGIGPKKHLEALGLKAVMDLPVGQNLQDHVMLNMYTGINSSFSLTANRVQSLWSAIYYKLFGKGPLSIGGAEGVAFLYSDEAMRTKTYADIQLIFYSNFLHDLSAFNLRKDAANEYLAPTPNEEGFGISVIPTHPQSRGCVKLRSSDPYDQPIIDPQYLTDKQDMKTMIAGLELWGKLMETSTFQKLGTSINRSKMSFCSHHKFRSDGYWECHASHLALSMSHHAGTCKMGNETDSTSVVDPTLKVKGIKGLRVVDASIFPNITGGNIYAPTLMIAEKASDMIRGIDSVQKFRNVG